MAISFSYTYCANGQKQTFTMPGGTSYGYMYNEKNQLTSLSIPGVGDITYPSYTLNRPDRVEFPGGSSQSYQYDDLMRLERIVSSTSGLDYQYTSYDGVSNILTKQTEHGNYIYDYDDVYRLTSADSPTLDDEAYTYDGVGNRETASDVTGDITHNENNELTVYGEMAYEYDANGNMIRKSIGSAAVNYIYDVANRLIRVEDDTTQTVIAEYYYDPFGRRLWKEVDGTRTYFLYADEGLVAEYDESGEEIRSYGYQPDSTWTTDPLFLKEDGVYYWYQNDHLGTPQKMIDVNGTVVWSALYNAFGKADIQIETVTNNLRFPGQYYDVETGLHYNWFRYYDPGIGRYLRVDPIGFTRGDINLFLYGKNNPPNRRDPLGLSSGECVKGLNECIVRKAKAYVGRTDVGDCADVALTALIECAAELNIPLTLPTYSSKKGKYISYRSKDFKSTEKFAKKVRKDMGAESLFDTGGPRITVFRELEDLQPGDLILYDLRHHNNPNYKGHTRILIEIDEDAWFWPYTVVEGHTGGGAVEESSYAMDGWILRGLADSWRGPADGKARTWNCKIFR